MSDPDRMGDPVQQIVARADDGALMAPQSAENEAALWVQAHRAAAQAAVATALGVRVLRLELHDGPPPLGVVRLAEPGANASASPDAHPDADPGASADPDSDVPPDHGRVRLLAYTVAAPIAARVAGVGGVPLQGEAAYHLATAVLAQLREPDTLDTASDEGQVAQLLLDRFGERADDAAEAAEHLAMNVEAWLSQHWGGIAVVAMNLLRHRQLSGDGVRQLMPPSTTATGLTI